MHDDILDATKDYSGEHCAEADNTHILRAIERIERRLEVYSRVTHPPTATSLRSYPQHPSMSNNYKSPYQANRLNPSPDRRFTAGKPELHEVQELSNNWLIN